MQYDVTYSNVLVSIEAYKCSIQNTDILLCNKPLIYTQILAPLSFAVAVVVATIWVTRIVHKYLVGDPTKTRNGPRVEGREERGGRRGDG